jgi:hypothetical protein|tara:strand:+ start:773 stop:958 length:186 start_codon:yes stop_codon:yes gene_type:complete
MKDLISFKNAQIEALQIAISESDAYVMQLESFIFELTDKDSPEEYKAVIRNEIFNIQENEQ